MDYDTYWEQKCCSLEDYMASIADDAFAEAYPAGADDDKYNDFMDKFYMEHAEGMVKAYEENRDYDYHLMEV